MIYDMYSLKEEVVMSHKTALNKSEGHLVSRANTLS